jgi:voltage-gated potassium channel
MRIDHELKERLHAWDWSVLFVAIVALLALIIETFVPLSTSTMHSLLIVDRYSCYIFMIDVLVRWRRMGWSSKYWKWGWLDLLASLPLDTAFRALQAIRIYRFIRLVRIMYKFKGVTAGTTLSEKILAVPIVVSVAVLFSSALIIEAEKSAPDVMIKTGGDAIWWALSTITTVGYGDIYPVTTEGRFIAAILMLFGVGLYGSISAYVISKILLPKEIRDHEGEMREIRALHKEIKELRDEIRKHAPPDSKDKPPSLPN